MGIYLVTHKYRLLAQEVRNTFYYETTAAEPDNGEWQDIADEIRADFVAELAAHVVDDLTLYGIDRRRVDSAGLLTIPEVFTAGEIDGSAVIDPLPTQIALLISNKGVTVKPNRARSYLAGFHEDSVASSLFLAGPRLAAETFIDLQSDLNAIGTNPLQRVAAQWNTGHTMVVDSNDLSGAASIASIVPATQRRRRIGVGI